MTSRISQTIRLYDISDVETVSGKLVIAGYKVSMKIVAKANQPDQYHITIEEEAEQE